LAKRGRLSWTADTFVGGIASNNGEVIEWLKENDCPISRDVVYEAARQGQVDTLEWLKEERRIFFFSSCAGIAAEHGHINILEYLKELGGMFNLTIFSAAAKGGHIEVGEYLRANNCPWDIRVTNIAAFFGHFEFLKWLRAENCPWDENSILEEAVYGGNLEMLNWLRAEGCEWNGDTYEVALEFKNQAIIEWLKEGDCPQY